MTHNFYSQLENLLKKNPRFVDQDGDLLKSNIIDAAFKADKKLVELLLSQKQFKDKFFNIIPPVGAEQCSANKNCSASAIIFNINDFVSYIQDKNFLADSYTKYRNKIGLNIDSKFLNERKEVALVWPFKDCILEGGQTREDAKQKEIFFNEILAQDEIDKLLAPKVLTNWKRYVQTGIQFLPLTKGEIKRGLLKRDNNGTIRENLIIKGNNLLALYSLKQQFQNKIKLIYIDPPYNPDSPSNTFCYNNNFNHSTWLTFMKNRLEVARDLLQKNGIICIAIDHNELLYFGVLSDEVFGRENRLGIISVVHNPGGRQDDKFFSTSNEFMLVYARDINNAEIKNLPFSNQEIKEYKLKDDKGRYKLTGLQRTGNNSNRTDRPNLFYPIFLNPNKLNISIKRKENYIEILPLDNNRKEKCWRWSKKKLIKEKDNIFIKKTGDKYVLYIKNRLVENEGKKPKTFWYKPEYSGQTGTSEIKKLFDDKVFVYPKSPYLIKDVLRISTENSDIILDFFAGSGTTAQAVLELNKEDNGNRKFILVEQMEYVEKITVERVKKVMQNLAKEKNLFSKKEEPDFVYCELMKYNEMFVEKIVGAQNFASLQKIWQEMKTKSFLNYNVDIKKFEETIEEFKKLPLAKQKRTLFDLLNKNQLYVNLSEIEDKEFGVGEGDKKMNINFYCYVSTEESIEALRESYPEVNNIINLKEVIANDPHKLEELPLAVRFIKFLNKTYNTDYELSSEQPKQNSKIDILINNRKNTKQELKLQIQAADPEMKGTINKQLAKQRKLAICTSHSASFCRIENSNDRLKWIADAIQKKKSKQNGQELILLLEGFYTIGHLNDNDIRKIQKDCKNSGFQEIWIGYIDDFKKIYSKK